MAFVLQPIRSDNSYFGVSLEPTPGTPVAPSIFPRWMDGSQLEYDLTAEDVQEGDGSRRLSFIIKNRQMVKIKIVATLRANELGFFEAAAMGVGADSYTAPTVSTTLSSSVAAGATSIPISSTANVPASGTIALVLGAGTANEEIPLFTLPASGNTLTVSPSYNGGALKYSHSNTGNAGMVKQPATHTLTDQADGNYYTIEVALGSLNGANGTTLRVRSCKLDTFKRSSKAGGLIMHEMEFVGIACAVQSTPATVTLEQHQPFLYTQGAWTLDGSTTDADTLAIEMFDIEQKNNVDTTLQTEQLTLAGMIFGMLSVGLAFDIVFTKNDKIYQTYFGSKTGTTDAQTIGTGSFSVTFTQPDTFQSVTYTIPNVAYTKTTMPSPKKDGKAFKLSVSATGITAGGATPYVLQTTITNTQYASY